MPKEGRVGAWQSERELAWDTRLNAIAWVGTKVSFVTVEPVLTCRPSLGPSLVETLGPRGNPLPFPLVSSNQESIEIRLTLK